MNKPAPVPRCPPHISYTNWPRLELGLLRWNGSGEPPKSLCDHLTLKLISILLRVLKCGAGEGCRGSVGSILRKMKNITWNQWWKNILHTIKRGKAKWVGHIFRRYCLIKHVIEGKIEGKWKGRDKGAQDARSTGWSDAKRRYCNLNEAALDQTLGRTRFGRGYGQVARQSTQWMSVIFRNWILNSQ